MRVRDKSRAKKDSSNKLKVMSNLEKRKILSTRREQPLLCKMMKSPRIPTPKSIVMMNLLAKKRMTKVSTKARRKNRKKSRKKLQSQSSRKEQRKENDGMMIE